MKYRWQQLPRLTIQGSLLGLLLLVPAAWALQNGDEADVSWTNFEIQRRREQACTEYNPEKMENEAEKERESVREAMSQPPADFPHYAKALAEKHTAMGTGNRIPASGVTIPLGIADFNIPENVVAKVAPVSFDVMVFGSAIALLFVFYWRNRTPRVVTPAPKKPH